MIPADAVKNTKKFRILYIEDAEPERREFAEFARSQTDVEAVWCAADIGEGVRLLIEKQPDIVLLDWLLEKNVRGYHFLKEVQKLKGRRPCIYVVSNLSSEYARTYAANTGLVDDFLLKSVPGYGPDYLMQVIRRYHYTLFDTSAAAVRPNPVRREAETAAESAGPEPFTRETLRAAIGEILKDLGLTPMSQAYSTMTQALVYACMLCYKRGVEGSVNLEQEIYSHICRSPEKNARGGKMKTDAIRSNLRNAIGTIYAKGDQGLLLAYCPSSGSNGSLEVKNFLLTFAYNFVRKFSQRFPLQG